MISRCVRFRTLILISILCENAFVEVVNSAEPWYSKLPDYYLHGVPKGIVDNEKNWVGILDAGFKIFGGAGKSEYRIQKARRFQVWKSVFLILFSQISFSNSYGYGYDHDTKITSNFPNNESNCFLVSRSRLCRFFSRLQSAHII